MLLQCKEDLFDKIGAELMPQGYYPEVLKTDGGYMETADEREYYFVDLGNLSEDIQTNLFIDIFEHHPDICICYNGRLINSGIPIEHQGFYFRGNYVKREKLPFHISLVVVFHTYIKFIKENGNEKVQTSS